MIHPKQTVAIVNGVVVALDKNVRASSLRDPHRIYQDVADRSVTYVAGAIVEPGRVKQALHQSLIDSLPRLGQRQDSLSDQARDLADVADRLGMYDVADLLKRLGS